MFLEAFISSEFFLPFKPEELNASIALCRKKIIVSVPITLRKIFKSIIKAVTKRGRYYEDFLKFLCKPLFKIIENHEDTLANVQKRPLSNERKTFMELNSCTTKTKQIKMIIINGI